MKQSERAFRFLSAIVETKITTVKQAYEAGRSSVIDGPNQTNCHCRFFRKPALMKAWERGYADAEAKEKEE